MTENYPKNIRDWNEADRARLLSEFVDNARTGTPTYEDMAAEYGVSTDQILDWKDQTLNNVDARMKDPLQSVVEQANADMKAEENKQLDNKAQHITKIVRTIGIVAIILLVVVNGGKMAIEKLTAPTEFNPYSYIKMKYTGISGYGSAEATFDAKKASKDLGQSISQKDVVITVDGNDRTLKNGDQVTVEVKDTADLKEKKLTASPNRRDYTVVGLINGSPVDAFKDVKVQFSGLNGNGTVKVTNNSTDDLLKTAEYTVDKSSNLKNGETITVSVKADPDTAISVEKYPSETKKEYKVEGLGAYVEKTDDISEAGWAALNTVAEKEITDTLIAKDQRNFATVLGLNGYYGVPNDSEVVKRINAITPVRAYVVSENVTSPTKTGNDNNSNDNPAVVNGKNVIFLIYNVQATAVRTGGDGKKDNGAGTYLWTSYTNGIVDSQGNLDTNSIRKDDDGYTDNKNRAYVDVDSLGNQIINNYRLAGYEVTEKDF